MGMDPKALERLHNSEDFLAFLEEVYSQREGWISNLHDRNTDVVQYKTLKAKWASLRQ